MYISVCVYIYTYTCIYTCIHMSIYIHTSTQRCIRWPSTASTATLCRCVRRHKDPKQTPVLIYAQYTSSQYTSSIYTSIYIYTSTQRCTRWPSSATLCRCVYIYGCVYRRCIHVYVYMYTHTDIYISTYIYIYI